MSETIFDRWNKTMDVEGIKEDSKKSDRDNRGDYPEIPVGTYEVKLDKGEIKATKNGDPMVSIWFKILDGEYKDNLIFMNQVITKGFQIHIVDDFLKSLGTGIDVYFDDYKQYNDLIMDIVESCENKLEFALEYGINNKGFHTFKITEIFDIQF